MGSRRGLRMEECADGRVNPFNCRKDTSTYTSCLFGFWLRGEWFVYSTTVCSFCVTVNETRESGKTVRRPHCNDLRHWGFQSDLTQTTGEISGGPTPLRLLWILEWRISFSRLCSSLTVFCGSGRPFATTTLSFAVPYRSRDFTVSRLPTHPYSVSSLSTPIRTVVLVDL